MNAQADALSLLRTAGETVPHDENNYIPALELDIVSVVFRPNRNRNEAASIDTKLGAMDKLYAARDAQAPTNFSVETIGMGEFLQAQLNDPFCAEFR